MKKRIVGGLLMAVILVPLTLLGGYYFLIACSFLGIAALKELLDLKEHHQKIPNLMVGISVFALVGLIFSEGTYSYGIHIERIVLTLLLLFLPTLFYRENKYTTRDAFYLSGVVLFLGITFGTIGQIRNADLWILLYLVLIAVSTDTFAMLIGKFIGKRKCAPFISPNKTWEGTIGGLLLGAGLSSLFYFYKIGILPLYKILLLSVVLSIVGQLGDLFFSKIKRENKIKDYSKLIPGHGGVLDRFDSLIFIVLAYVLLFGMV